MAGGHTHPGEGTSAEQTPMKQLTVTRNKPVTDTTMSNLTVTGRMRLPGTSSVITIGATPPTSATAGTGIWIDRTGLYSLASDMYQVKIDATTGDLLVGGGKITLDATGITLIDNAGIIYYGANPFIHILASSGVAGEENVFFGVGAGNRTALAGAISNVGIGTYSLKMLTLGARTIAIGANAVYGDAGGVSGSDNIGIGDSSLLSVSSGAQNIGIGVESLKALGSGVGNTAIGNYALKSNTSATGLNVALGYAAGYYETGSNKLFIDNATRASEADGRAKALIYGVFDAATANQSLAFNCGTVSVLGTITGTQLISNIATGTAPLAVTSTTVCTNLNASFLEGYSAAAIIAAGGGGGGASVLEVQSFS